MARIIITVLVALIGPAWAEPDIYEKDWYTHHLVCGKEQPPPFTDLLSFLYIHFTFQTGHDGKVKKIVGQRERVQFPNFAKVTTYQSYIVNGGVHWSEVEQETVDELIVTLVSQDLKRLHNSKFTISRTKGTYTVSYFSIYNNGERKFHRNDLGVCWIEHGQLF